MFEALFKATFVSAAAYGFFFVMQGEAMHWYSTLGFFAGPLIAELLFKKKFFRKPATSD